MFVLIPTHALYANQTVARGPWRPLLWIIALISPAAATTTAQVSVFPPSELPCSGGCSTHRVWGSHTVFICTCHRGVHSELYIYYNVKTVKVLLAVLSRILHWQSHQPQSDLTMHLCLRREERLNNWNRVNNVWDVRFLTGLHSEFVCLWLWKRALCFIDIGPFSDWRFYPMQSTRKAENQSSRQFTLE